MNRADFKARVATRKALLLPGVANALAARVAEDIGYEALYVTGAGVANTQLGLPDLGILNLTDMAEAVARIGGAVDLPLVVDADTGYGDSINCYHAVRRLEAAGAAAIQIEDQTFPKRCGHFEGKEIVPVGEMVGKIHAAVDARRDSDLQIIARTDACAVEGYAAAINRAQIYAEAGADVLFVEALTTSEQIADAPRRLDRPQLINIVYGGKTPELPMIELEAMGYTLLLYANAALQAAVAGMQTVLGALHSTGSLADVHDRLADFAERQRLVRTQAFDGLRFKYAAGVLE
jgi:2-methylisocitrate lyase-like PEP mutase family enzyme